MLFLYYPIIYSDADSQSRDYSGKGNPPADETSNHILDSRSSPTVLVPRNTRKRAPSVGRNTVLFFKIAVPLCAHAYLKVFF